MDDTTARAVLPADTLLVRAAELPEPLRRQLGLDSEGWVLTRPSLRTTSRILDDGSAALLEELRQPSTIAEAVLRYAGARELDPEETLAAAYPFLSQLLADGFLVLGEGEMDESPTLAPGADIAVPPSPRRAVGGALPTPDPDFLLRRILDRLTAGHPPEKTAGSGLASLHSGAAGIAYAFYRIALARESPELLAAAGRWANQAAHLTQTEGGCFEAPEHGLTSAAVGRTSPYHTASGVWCVQALLAHHRGDDREQAQAVQRFVAAVEPADPRLDLTLGQAGILLAAAQLLDISSPEGAGALRELGGRVVADLWQELDAQPPIAECIELPSLGMAHGWAGYAYATLRWCRSAGFPWPRGLPARLAELADAAEAWGRGLRWRWYGSQGTPRRDIGSMPGWCNGSAGLVYLWALAADLAGEPRFRALAEGAAWNAWGEPASSGNLCCGLTGRAYALLHLYRHGGGREWLERARRLAELAARDVSWAEEMPDSLFRGEVGLAVLAADLARPESAVMPFFEEPTGQSSPSRRTETTLSLGTKSRSNFLKTP